MFRLPEPNDQICDRDIQAFHSYAPLNTASDVSEQRELKLKHLSTEVPERIAEIYNDTIVIWSCVACTAGERVIETEVNNHPEHQRAHLNQLNTTAVPEMSYKQMNTVQNIMYLDPCKQELNLLRPAPPPIALPPATLLLKRIPREVDLSQELTSLQTLTHVLELWGKSRKNNFALSVSIFQWKQSPHFHQGLIEVCRAMSAAWNKYWVIYCTAESQYECSSSSII